RRRLPQRSGGARALNMATDLLGFGLIGAGAIANFHARAVAASNGGRLVGVVSRSRASAEKFAREHGIDFASDDVESLLAQPGVDAVCITTPSALHLEPALAAIRAGKHLMIEKPLDATVEGTDRILGEAAKAGVRVGSIFQARYGDPARALKAAVDAGRFGRMVLASCYVKWNRTAEYYTGWKGRLSEDGGGAVINQAIHGVDLLQWFAGMPVEVFAWITQRVHVIESEDTAVAALKFASGAFGTIEASTALWPGYSRRLEICGENGSAVMEDDDITRWDFREARAADESIRTARETSAKGSGAADPMAINFAGHLRQIQDFIDGIRERRPFFIEGSEARKAVALVRAIYESAASGKPVRPDGV
ncbi:MAG: Gfo/Idh/MocA family oxidoreductase, partial [Pseudomonadota bacterium]